MNMSSHGQPFGLGATFAKAAGVTSETGKRMPKQPRRKKGDQADNAPGGQCAFSGGAFLVVGDNAGIDVINTKAV
jgi:hypothetical protein